jgi:hypothetical protein
MRSMNINWLKWPILALGGAGVGADLRLPASREARINVDGTVPRARQI